MRSSRTISFFFFNDTATTEIYTLSLHDALPILLPLDGRGGLAADVEDHPVDAAHFVGDPAGDPRHQVPGQTRPVGGHSVEALDGAQDAGGLVGALVAHHADRLDRQEHRERLPEILA